MNVSQFLNNLVGRAQLSPALRSSAASCGQSFWVPLSTQTCFLGVRFYTRSSASFHGEARSRMQSASVTAEPCCTGEREFWHAGPSWLLDKRWAQLPPCSGMGSEFAVADLG